jgi:hypothetical protein
MIVDRTLTRESLVRIASDCRDCSLVVESQGQT